VVSQSRRPRIGPCAAFLSEMYENGRGVPQDYALAYTRFSLWMARIGDMVPERQRSRTLEAAEKFLDGLGAKMTPAQIVDAQ
jgi:TPR repeat protein